MSVVDDYGRYYASPAAIRGACWPTAPEKVSERQIAAWLTECTAGEWPLLQVYSVNGCHFLSIHCFGQRIQGKSKFPEPLPFITVENGEEPENIRSSRSRISETKSESESINTLSSTEDADKVPVWGTPESLIELYNELTPDELPMVESVSPGRIKKASQYLKAFPKRQFWVEAFGETKKSSFLKGLKNNESHPNFRGDFDWLLTRGKDGTENISKVWEGKYRD